jgi:hypothetical protein
MTGKLAKIDIQVITQRLTKFKRCKSLGSSPVSIDATHLHEEPGQEHEMRNPTLLPEYIPESDRESTADLPEIPQIDNNALGLTFGRANFDIPIDPVLLHPPAIPHPVRNRSQGGAAILETALRAQTATTDVWDRLELL